MQHSRGFASQNTFAQLGVSPELLDRLGALGLHAPLPVQAAAFPVLAAGRNAAIKSCTGSGKTLAYLLPVMQRALERRAAAAAAARALRDAGKEPAAGGPDTASRASVLKQHERSLQALIVAPSRELCIQIQRTAQELLSPSDKRLVVQLIGGANPRRQEEALGALPRPLVAVGTPGRVGELVTRGSLHLWGCPVLVLDEVDELMVHTDYRRCVDLIASHVGRRAAPAPLPPHLHPSHFPSHRPGSFPPGAGADPSNSSGAEPAGRTASEPASRQTVIVSASLDARNLARYAAWCPDPAPLVLSSHAALPAPYGNGLAAIGAAGGRRQPTAKPHAGSADGGGVPAPAELTPSDASAEAGTVAETAAPLAAHLTAAATTTPTAPPTPTPATPAPTADAATTDAAAAAPGPLTDVLPPHLAHVYVTCASEHRTDTARRLIHALGAERVLLFVGLQRHVMVTKYRLEARNMAVSVLHGQLTKLERGNIVEAFRRGVFRTLVVTDLGARGLDLPECDAVVCLGVPSEALSYAHRAGRTGRAGAPGVVASVVGTRDVPRLQAVARRLGVPLQAISLSQGTIAPSENSEGGAGVSPGRQRADMLGSRYRDAEVGH